MKGGKEEEREGETKYERLRCVAWNINGWKGEAGYRKIRRIRGEVGEYDVFILTETHTADDDEERERSSPRSSRTSTCSMSTRRRTEAGGWEWR